MAQRNSTQRVQDVIDRLSDLNVRELDALAHALTRYNNLTLRAVIEQVVHKSGRLVTFPVKFERDVPEPEDSPAPSIAEDDLPIIRAAREHGVSS